MGTIDLRGDGVNTEMETGSRSTAAPIVAHRASWSEKFRGTPLTEANQAIQAYAWTVGQLRYAQLPHSPTTQPQPDISFATESGHLHLLLTVEAHGPGHEWQISFAESRRTLTSGSQAGRNQSTSCVESEPFQLTAYFQSQTRLRSPIRCCNSRLSLRLRRLHSPRGSSLRAYAHSIALHSSPGSAAF